MTELWPDVRYAIRTLRQAPAYATAAILCLALGIGANAAIFTVVDAYLFRPLPVEHPSNLVVVGTRQAGAELAGDGSYGNYLDMRAERDVFEDLAAYVTQAVSLRVGTGTPDRRIIESVSDNYWSMLGVHAVRGRMFTAEEALHRDPLIVVSDRFWRRQLSADPAAVGRTLMLNGLPFTIVGVAPSAFEGTESVLAEEGWIPASMLQQLNGDPTDDLLRRRGGGYKIMGRLRAGVTAGDAERALNILAGQLARAYPGDERGVQFVVRPELRSRPDIAVTDLMPRIATVFMGLVALVLLIACANVMSLILARSSARHTELAVRAALGAHRRRLVQQLLTETAVVALGGALAGAALAWLIVRWLTTWHVSSDIPIRLDLRMDWRVLAFTVAATVGTALLSGLMPALKSAHSRLAETLGDAGRGSSGSAGQRFRSALVVAQVAFAFVVLVCAGLFVRSADQATRVDLGFRSDHRLVATIDVALRRYDDARGKQFFHDLLTRAAEMPGVQGAALAGNIPFGTSHQSTDIFADTGHVSVETNTVTPGYFDVMGMRLEGGRDFTVRDDSLAPSVAVINAALARLLWPGDDPIGRHFKLRVDGPEVQVVGLVATAKTVYVGEPPRPFLYLPFGQRYRPAMTLHLHTKGDPALMIPAARGLVASMDPELAVYHMTTMAEHLRDGFAFFFLRLAAALAGGFGLLGLVQAVIGLYGVIAYSAAQRTREIGIRMALGATPFAVLRDVLVGGLLVTVTGVAIGLLVALAATRALGGMLTNVSVHDPLTFGVLAVALSAITLLACWVPARRASRLSPVRAMA